MTPRSAIGPLLVLIPPYRLPGNVAIQPEIDAGPRCRQGCRRWPMLRDEAALRERGPEVAVPAGLGILRAMSHPSPRRRPMAIEIEYCVM